MKKILLLLAICGSLFMASCTKQYNEVVPNTTSFYDLTSTSWTADTNNEEYDVTLNSSIIDQYFNANGGINVYLTFDNGTTYEQIPEVYNGLSFSYTYTAGGITVYAQNADGTMPAAAPNALTVKVVFIPSTPGN